MIGDKHSLELLICEIIGIPAKALQGCSPSTFSITKRIAWQESWETTRNEVEAYVLLGNFDIYMSLIYGEGRNGAFRRLREEIEKVSKGELISCTRARWSIPYNDWKSLIESQIGIGKRARYACRP